MNGQQNPPEHVALTFVGPINYPATKFLRNACCQAVNAGTKRLTLLISSNGGSTAEGFALYHFLRALPLETTMHNIGSIDSIANVCFLAGKNRFACANTRFMFHDLTWTYGQQETLDRDHMRERIQSLDSDAAQFLEIFKLHTSLTDDLFETLKLLQQPSFISPVKAKEFQIINEITEANIPAGMPIYNIEF